MKDISSLPNLDPATSNRPFGVMRNVVTPGDGTGTPVEQSYVQDLYYAIIALLDSVGISPDNSEEGVDTSQFVTAVEEAIVAKLAELLSTTGDLLAGGASGVQTVSPGSDGQILTANSLAAGGISWSSSTAVRVGEIGIFVTSSPPADVLYLDRQTVSRTTYATLWNWVQTNSADVFDASGTDVQKYGPGDGSTTFDLPDWRGLHLRGAGTSSSFQKADGTNYDGGSLLDVQLDQIQHHQHNTPNLPHQSGVVSTPGSDANAYGNATKTSNAIVADGAGTPRTGDETRPVGVAIHYGVYIQ